jgi:hypothetical protein
MKRLVEKVATRYLNKTSDMLKGTSTEKIWTDFKNKFFKELRELQSLAKDLPHYDNQLDELYHIAEDAQVIGGNIQTLGKELQEKVD